MEKTIAKVGYAMITEENDNSTTYEAKITYFESGEAGGREVKASPQGEMFEIEADGVIVHAGEVNSGYDIELTLLDIIDDIREKWLKRVKTSDGHLETGGAVVYPKFALIVAKETMFADKKYAIDVYYCCQVLERPEKTAKTSAKQYDPEFPTYKIGSRPRRDNKWVHREVFADELPNAVPVTAPAAQSSGSGRGNSGSGS